ncbi:MAG: leucine-rich repeat domain-containing protein [Candidatus Azobacteroides sp.]|nr:leucine-rich repeat domain-containing protein [Candidatus Azobacteroides sp.]
MINLTIVKEWNIGNPGYNSNVTATLYSDGELDIASAAGGSKMVDFGDPAEGEAPWKLEGYHTSIKNVYIVNVGNIGNRAFKDCSNLVSVTFYNNYLKIIGRRAFDKCTSLQEIKIPNKCYGNRKRSVSGVQQIDNNHKSKPDTANSRRELF